MWQTDFSEADYTNWREGEPNDDGDAEADCVHLVCSIALIAYMLYTV